MAAVASAAAVMALAAAALAAALLAGSGRGLTCLRLCLAPCHHCSTYRSANSSGCFTDLDAAIIVLYRKRCKDNNRPITQEGLEALGVGLGRVVCQEEVVTNLPPAATQAQRCAVAAAVPATPATPRQPQKQPWQPVTPAAQTQIFPPTPPLTGAQGT